MNPLFANSTTNPQGVTVIRNAVVHYAPYACQYTKHGDIQTDIASGVTCHHCKARLGADTGGYKGILAEAEWPHGGKEVVYSSGILPNGETWAQAEENRYPTTYPQIAPIRFASIAPHFDGDNTKRAPIEWSDGRGEERHDCHDQGEDIFYLYGGWVIWNRNNYFSIRYCPYCGGLLPTPQLHEGNAPAQSTWTPVSQALPDDGELVIVKIYGGRVGLGECHRRNRNNWKVTMPDDGTLWGRSTVEEWKRI